MNNIIKQAIVALLLFVFSWASYAQQLRFVTEDLPPFHFMGADNKPAGALVDVIEALMIKTQLSAQIEFIPFARSYDLALNNKDIFMLSLMKSTDRKDLFQWVGQIFKSKAFLVGLRNREDINISNIEEAKSFVVGTIRGYHSEQYLKNTGFLEQKNLHLSVSYKHMWSMLFEQRIDFILTNFIAVDREMKSIGFNKDDIKPFIELHDFPGDLFIATGLKTADKTVTILSAALQQIKADGTYKNIMDKWGL
ncbi:transporter substrate-binding domain-containing protein [Colwellia sp. BRX8-4]|uniref:substrate-binding periplasmic protein n=1 Tax=Colwellia sp. BRX8-4 TaxID=2759836 RepID=UPI0015F38AF2|nr:transporter substrate-binding domain-containing protein [Colwellia sp. BRX8-4]MBA6372519.1 transporter substrate-binding domain-containing protein [Colwellia sp. BRX8-4]